MTVSILYSANITQVQQSAKLICSFCYLWFKKSRAFLCLKGRTFAKLRKKVAFSIVREGFSQRPTAFTPLTVRNFLDQRIELCGVIDQDCQLAIEQPVVAFDGDVAEYNVLFFRMMDVMLFTMPRSSCPTTCNVIG